MLAARHDNNLLKSPKNESAQKSLVRSFPRSLSVIYPSSLQTPECHHHTFPRRNHFSWPSLCCAPAICLQPRRPFCFTRTSNNNKCYSLHIFLLLVLLFTTCFNFLFHVWICACLFFYFLELQAFLAKLGRVQVACGVLRRHKTHPRRW